MRKFICQDCGSNEFKDVEVWKEYHPETSETTIRVRIRCANLDCCMATGYSYTVREY